LGLKKQLSCPAPVARVCNPNYSGGRDQEDHGGKPAQANSSQDPISNKNPSQKGTGGVAQGVGPEFKPQFTKEKKAALPSHLVQIHSSQVP
jgi:hypothetical protein